MVGKTLAKRSSCVIRKLGAFHSPSTAKPEEPARGIRALSGASGPAPGLAQSSRGLVTRAPARTSGLSPARPDPRRGSEALPRTKGGRRASQHPSPSAVPAHARPARPSPPTPRRGQRRAAPRRRPRGSPQSASQRSLGSHPVRPRAIPHLLLLGPQASQSCLAAPPHTWKGTVSTRGSVSGWVRTRGGQDARKSRPGHPLAARGGGRAAAGALAAVHMRR